MLSGTVTWSTSFAVFAGSATFAGAASSWPVSDVDAACCWQPAAANKTSAAIAHFMLNPLLGTGSATVRSFRRNNR
jgi:hypothetical protein